MNVHAGFSFVPQNAIDIELCLRITTKSTTLTLFDIDYRFRSMQFAACWFAPTGATNQLLIAPFGASFDSGNLHCVLLVNVPQPFARGEAITSRRVIASEKKQKENCSAL